MYRHRNFGPESFGPPDRNFQWKNGPPGPIFSVKMVHPWKFGPGHANWNKGWSLPYTQYLELSQIVTT